jgi:predicted permease
MESGFMRRWRSWMDGLVQDLRYALRRLLASPSFTLVAVLSLGLGIGANTALFTVVNTVVMGDSGYEDPGSLVKIYTAELDGVRYSTTSYPDYFDLRAEDEVFEDVISSNVIFVQSEVDGQDPILSLGEIVSGSFFDVLGLRPALGRGFLAEEDETPDTHPVVVLGYDYWQRTFNGARDVLGATVRILRRPYTVVGVAPDGFSSSWPGVTADFFVPTMMADHVTRSSGGTNSRLETRSSRSLFLIGRLKPGVTMERADAYLDAFSRRLGEEYPVTNAGRPMTALAAEDVSLHPLVDRAILPVAVLLFTVVGLVLLIACTNLASFLLARGTDRRKEIAVRLALGARRRVLVRQLLTETTLLAIIGGVAGWLFARWTIDIVLGFQPPIPVPLNLDLQVDGTVFAFNMLIALAAGLLFGLLPALQSTRPDVAPTLRDESGGQTGSRKRFELRNAMVSFQVALSLVLLIGAGLFVRSLQKAQGIDPGFDTGPAAIVWPNFEMSMIAQDEGQALWEELLQQARAIPGVTEAALSDVLPLGFGAQMRGVLPQGVAPPEGSRTSYDVDFRTIDGGYLDLLDIDVLRGRGYDEGDTRDSEPVIIVNHAFEERFWPGESGVGKTIQVGQRAPMVIGVTETAKVRTLGESDRPLIYLNYRQFYLPTLNLIVRGTLPEAQLLGALTEEVRATRSDLVIMDALTMSEHMQLSMFAPRLAATLLSVFGGLALLLSGIGLYGVVSYAVSQRTREVGVRMSLGADAWQVVRLLVGSGLKLVIVGGIVGLILSGTVTWLLQGFLYGVSSLDVATFLVIPAILLGVAALAAFVPARRASRVNPVDALRSE